MKMIRTSLASRTAAVLAAGILLTAGCGTDEQGCRSVDGMQVCGEVGAHLYSVALPGSGEVQWPAVALSDGRLMVARGTAVIEVGRDGRARKAAEFSDTLSVLAHDKGRIIAITNNWEASVVAWDGGTLAGGSPVATWVQPTSVAVGTAPATIGDGKVALTTSAVGGSSANGGHGRGWGRHAQVEIRDAEDGRLEVTIPGAAAPTLMPDGSYRVIADENGCGHYRRLQKVNASGKVVWSYEETDGGIVDYSPGAAGQVFAVTAHRNLRAIDGDGKLLWTFKPDCPKCTVAAAPTVTAEAIYFPVWVGADQWQCNENPWTSRPQGYDPLYALTPGGGLLWTYDGFASSRSRFNPSGLMPMSPSGGPVVDESSQHHPAGRPTIADDGTLYVAADGALVALSRNGGEVGRVLMRHSLGERKIRTSSPHYGTVVEHETGVHSAPVMGPSGRLYTWDGDRLHAFATGGKLAPAPWIAPFGGADNNGRVAR